jgi:hypothetical protein
MAKSLDSLLNFSGGEWSPKLDARVDQQKYKAALRKCLNMIPYKSGGLTRRPGTQYVAAAKKANTMGHDYGVRMVPFKFSPTTTFMLEFGSGYIRFYNQAGNQMTVTSPDAWVNIYAYNAGQYVTSGGIIYYCILAVPAQIPPATNPAPVGDPTHWVAQTILEQPTPYNADSGAAGPQPNVGNWGTDIWELAFCQINDVMYIVHPDYPVYSLTRFSDEDWVMAKVNFLAPALLDQNATDTQITGSATTGTGITLSVTAPAWVIATYYSIGNSVLNTGKIYTCVTAHVSSVAFSYGLHQGLWVETDVFNANHVGSTWQLAYLRASAYVEYDGTAAAGFANGTSSTIQALGAWEVHTYGVWSSDIAIQRSLDNGATWDTIRSVTGRSDRNVDIQGTAVQLGLYRIVVSNSAALVNAGATNPRIVFECVDSFLYGLVKITAVASSISATADVVSVLANTGPTEYWSEAAWSDYRGFPQAVTSFQQRVIYASSGYEPQRIWGTVTNDIENLALGDQTKATDSFAFDLNAASRGPIEWLISQTDLFAGFSGAEWVINSGSTNSNGQSSGAAITPTAINAVEHSSWGSAANVAPAIVGDAVLYTQRQATSLRQMMFSVYTNKYMSQDLTMLSDHLFTSGIAQLCYMTRWRKQSIVWALTHQGTLVGMTYDLDQEIFGWHPHTTGGGQVDSNNVPIAADKGFESVAVIDGTTIDDDQVWVVVNRLISGVNTRYIERMNPVNWEEVFTAAPAEPAPDLTQAYYIDSGQAFVTPAGLPTLTGLGHLNGRYVYGLADGYAFGPILVTAGVATLPDSISTTAAYIVIGLPIPYQGQPMRLDADARAGNTQGIIKQISDVYIRVWNSCGGAISNGTTQYPLWVAGTTYAAGDVVISPTTAKAYQCLSAVLSNSDPASNITFFAVTDTPRYSPPVPIPYLPPGSSPFASVELVTDPTDIRITPFAMPWPTHDPVIVVQGNDALPLTVLALICKYDITSAP